MNTLKYISIFLIAMHISLATSSQQDNTNSSGYIYDTEDRKPMQMNICLFNNMPHKSPE